MKLGEHHPGPMAPGGRPRGLVAALALIQNALVAAERSVLLAALGAMLISVLIAIASRLLAFDVPWVTPLVLALMIVSTFSGAALATATRRHITMDLATKALPQRGRAALTATTALLGAAITGFLAIAGSRWVRANMEFDDPISLALKLPDWWLQAVVPAGFGLCAAHFAINALLDWRAVITGDFSHLDALQEGGVHAVPASSQEPAP